MERYRTRFVVVVALLVVASGLGGAAPAQAKQDPPLLTVEVALPSGPQNACFVLVPAPGLVDKNVGSVARALAESFAKETGLLHAQLQRVYESSFVSTATGGADKVDLVLSALEGTDPKLVLAQADVTIGPVVGSERPVVSVELRDPQQHVPPDAEACTEAVLAGPKQKSNDSDENGDG